MSEQQTPSTPTGMCDYWRQRAEEAERKIEAMRKDAGVEVCDICGMPYTEHHHESRIHHKCHNPNCPRGNDGEWYASGSCKPAKEVALALSRENAALVDEIKRLTADRDKYVTLEDRKQDEVYKLQNEVDRLTASIGIRDAQIRQIQGDRSKLHDWCDLMVDDFKRIKSCPGCDGEIAGLCERAISNTKQHVPVIVQRDRAESWIQKVRSIFAPLLPIFPATRWTIMTQTGGTNGEAEIAGAWAEDGNRYSFRVPKQLAQTLLDLQEAIATELVLTIQRKDGETPHEFLLEAEKERDRLRGELKVETLARELAEADAAALAEAAYAFGSYALVIRGERYEGPRRVHPPTNDYMEGYDELLNKLEAEIGESIAGQAEHQRRLKAQEC